MIKRPSFQYYPADWRADSVFCCSMAARGLWHEMMNMMHVQERYGYLGINGVAIPPQEIARYCGCDSLEQYTTLLSELERHKVPGRTSNGVIFSRRMVQDESKRVKWGKQQKNHRDKNHDEECQRNVSAMSAPSSSSSSSPPTKKESKPSSAARKTKTSWPEYFSPTDKMTSFALECGLSVGRQFAAFQDYHLQNGSKFLDWEAAWRTWCRRAVEFGMHSPKSETRVGAAPQIDITEEQRQKLVERDREMRKRGEERFQQMMAGARK